MSDYMQTKGRIFDIQRFSVHDGPGIRTLVFLKGCYLRCQWCCNPEGQRYDIETMMQAGKPKIIGRDVTVEEVVRELVKDRPYYSRSGGGITLSGGECLNQPEFGAALLRACHENGLSTAIETTGFAAFETIERYLEHLDHVLMDIKHMDSAKHKAFTGQPNELILENAVKIARSGVHMIVRVPTIPTFNATVEEIGAIADFAAKLPNVTEIHLLPYQKYGTDKYAGLGLTYAMPAIEPPSAEHMELLKQRAARAGLRAQIGG